MLTKTTIIKYFSGTDYYHTYHPQSTINEEYKTMLKLKKSWKLAILALHQNMDARIGTDAGTHLVE